MWKKFWSWGWVVLLIVWEVILQPVWNLNVENLAIDQGISEGLGDNVDLISPSIFPKWLIDAFDFFVGDFLWGAAFVAATYLLVDFSTWRKKKEGSTPVPIVRPISHMYTDLSTVKDQIKRAVSNTPVGLRVRNVVGQTLPVGVAASLRSNLAQLRSYGIETPIVDESVLLADGEVFVIYIETLLPFVGKSQLEELRYEASRFVKKNKKTA